MTADDLPEITLLATGGTIANPPDVDGYLSGSRLVERIPDLDEIARIEAEDIASIASTCFTPDIWWRLHDRIRDLLDTTAPDGIVITHGSNTIEETAYFLQLTLDMDVPVVLTAAQRNHDTIGNDGDRNLYDAVRVAASDDARGRGVLVVANDTIYGARDVVKAVSSRPDAWVSPNTGPLGYTDKRGRINFYAAAERSDGAAFDFADREDRSFPRVDVVHSVAGSDGQVVDLLLEDGNSEGIVVAALPTGAPARPTGADTQSAALERAVNAGVPVVLSHRGLAGWPYEYEPFVRGDTLRPSKARILLALALLDGVDDRESIQALFDTY
jgi:L-asparaginase